MKSGVLWLAALMSVACAQTEPAPSAPLISGAINFRQPARSPAPTDASDSLAEAGRHGFCVVRFDVESSGVTHSHRLVDCEPRGVYEERSLQAARSIRYAPSNAPRRDLQHRFDF